MEQVVLRLPQNAPGATKPEPISKEIGARLDEGGGVGGGGADAVALRRSAYLRVSRRRTFAQKRRGALLLLVYAF